MRRAVSSRKLVRRCSSVTAKPRTDVSGVRSSCETAERMSSRRRSACRCSVTSWAVPSMATGSSPSSRSAAAGPATTRSRCRRPDDAMLERRRRRSATPRWTRDRRTRDPLGGDAGGRSRSRRPRCPREPEDAVELVGPGDHVASDVPSSVAMRRGPRLAENITVRASSALPASRSASVAPTTRRLTATSAKSACATWTRSVGVSAPMGISPAMAPHVPMRRR